MNITNEGEGAGIKGSKLERMDVASLRKNQSVNVHWEER
jgi:hypothetical protein